MHEDSARLAEPATAARTTVQRVGRFVTVVLIAFLPACAPSGGAQSAPTLASPPPASTLALTSTDAAWVQLTIAMEEAIVPLLDLAADRAAKPRLGQLAIDVRDGALAVLPGLRELRDQGGLPQENPHRGHRMPGMVTADQLTRAAALQGDEFDQLVRESLRAHLEQQNRLARLVHNTGSDESVRTVAGQIEQSTGAQLALLNRLLAGPK